MAVLTNALDKLLGYQMRRATAVLMTDFVRTLSDFDMRPAEVTTLLVIAENPDCSQSEVGEALAIKRANMVPIIARLIERGLVAPDLEHPDQAGIGDVLGVAVVDAAVLGAGGGQHGHHVRAEGGDVPGRAAHRAGDDQAHACSSHGFCSARRCS